MLSRFSRGSSRLADIAPFRGILYDAPRISAELHAFEERVILPHERTLRGPKIDRMQLVRATRGERRTAALGND
jgi:hypothetical protein